MSNHTHTTWTEDRRRVVANLLREGKSAAQIATFLDVSRNAVIGIVQRDPILREIGFERSPGGNQRGKPKPHPRRPDGPVRSTCRSQIALAPLDEDAPSIAIDAENSQACEASVIQDSSLSPLLLPLKDLNHTQCRFSMNAPEPGDEHLFCGLPVDEGSRFCNHHHRRVFVSGSRKKF